MKNQKINNQSIIFKLLFILAVVFLFSSSSIRAATSPDAIAFRVMPNPGHLSPLRWYQENIKLKGSPQGLTVDGYEAVRDGRTVYVNAANINSPDTPGSTFYTNIYIISYNQQAESATVDIFGQILARWKFNTNISEPEDNKETVAKSCLYSSECSAGEYCLSLKAKIIRDTKRLADLSDIKLVLDNYQEAHNGDYPALTAGSYVAGKSLSVWPSWQATLAKELGVILPLDPVNRLGDCSNPSGYDRTTCWNQTLKKFAVLPANSQAYVYTYNGKKSYNLCALMESGYLTTLQGACAGSAVGYKVTCVDNDAAWIYKYPLADVCTKDKVMRTSNCGKIEYVSGGKTGGICGCVDTYGTSCTSTAANNCGTHGTGIYGCAGICPATRPADGVIACSGKTDCDDGKACTTDTCNNSNPSNPCNSSCNHAVSGRHLVCSNHSCVATDNTSSTCTNQDSCATAGAACDCVTVSDPSCNSLPNNCRQTNPGTKNCLGNCPATPPTDVVINCNNNATDQPNCQNTASHPDNSEPNSAGTCCPDETCYKCAAGYSWNGKICEVSTRPCAIPWGGTIAHGKSITAWQASSVAYGLDCVSESRLCTDSKLSGSYQSQSCVAPGCGDGNLDAGNGEECDPPDTTANCKTVALTPCGNVTVQGSKTCLSGCKWLIVNGDICQGSQPTTEENTSTLCDTSNKPLTDYACCVLTKCSQDGCACCGRGLAPLVSGFTSISTMKVDWELWGSRIPTPGWDESIDTTYNVPKCPSACQSATRCGQYKTAADTAGSCKTFIKDALGKDTSRTTSNNCPSDSCRLSRDQRSFGNPRNWYVTTNDSTAYYKCWK